MNYIYGRPVAVGACDQPQPPPPCIPGQEPVPAPAPKPEPTEPTEPGYAEQGEPLGPVKSIRRFCINCSGGSRKAPRKCSDRKCWLWEYRLGRNPRRKGVGGRPTPTQEEKIDSATDKANSN